MISNKVPKMILFGVLAAVILFALMPMIGIANTETRTADNEGASDMRFNLGSGMMFTREYRVNLSELTVTGGSSDLSFTPSEMIVYSDDNCAVICDSHYFYLLAEDYLQPAHYLGQYVKVQNTSGGLKITNSQNNIVLDRPMWYYLPAENGDYAYFENGTEVHLNESARQSVAGFYAGWGAYNEVAYNLVTDRTEDTVSTASWTLSATGTDTYTAPVYIDGTYTRYTDGDWTYVHYPDSTSAVIVAYTGSGGAITVPAKVGGLPVITVGNNADPLFDVAQVTSLTISEGIKNIATKCFYNANSRDWSGTLTLPSTLEYIGSQSFRYSHFTGVLVIPENVGYIGYNAFEEGNYTSLVVKSSAIPYSSAYASTSIREVLNLGDATYSKTSYGLSADSVSNDTIPGMGYMANASYTYQTQRTGTIAGLFWLIPLVFLIGIMIAVVRYINNKDTEKFE